MPETLQKMIDNIEEPSLMVLGYGPGGNGLDGIQSGEHVLLVPGPTTVSRSSWARARPTRASSLPCPAVTT